MRAIFNFTVCSLLLVFAACAQKPTQNQNAGLPKAATTEQVNAAPKDNPGDIVLGGIFALTGEQASFGVSTKNGVELALKEINASGGVLGRKIKILGLDDQSKPEEAATIMTRFATQDKVTAVIGDVASSNSLAMGPVAQANKIPFISPASTNPKVTQIGDYIFRVCFIDPFQGTVMAKFAHESLKAKRVAILRDMKSDYSMGLADYFAKTFQALGGEVITDQSYAAGDVDFKSQLTSIKAQSPEAIFVPGYYTESALIARQAKELGLTVPLMGGDGWDSAKLVEIGGDAVEGHYFSNHYSPEDPSEVTQKFVTDYKAAYHSSPDALAALGYDALKVMVDAIKRAGSTDAQAIRDAIALTKDLPGAAGTITMNSERNVDKPAVVLQIQSGKFVFKEKVNP